MPDKLPTSEVLSDETSSSTSYKSRLIARFILEHHPDLLDGSQRDVQQTSGRIKPPVMLSMQGPQGAGKSTLAASLQALLQNQPYGLNVAVVSLDDFYLTHQGLVDLANEYPENKLLHGRGQPGTHDVPLLVNTLQAISHINDIVDNPSITTESSRTVDLPVFDKSLFNGQGDRTPLSIQIKGPLDVFILEGWSLGFQPLPAATLESYHSQSSPVPPPFRPSPYKMHDHPLSAILQINTNLQTISQEVYPFFPLHVVIRPMSYDYVYAWRLQQERQMKALNGGRGMGDDEVRRFVDRYMPAYEVWGNEALRAGLEAEEGEKVIEREVLELVFDEERRVVQS